MVTGTAMNYYEILGVPKSASQEEIRQAYRKLSKKYHPDRNRDDASAEEKFKQVQKSWDVLGDEKKREQYDQFGRVFPDGQGPGAGQAWSSAGPGEARTWTWSSSGGGLGGDAGSGGMDIDLESLFGGTGGFGSRGGFGGGGFGAQTQAWPRRGQDARTEFTVPFHVAAEGGKYDVSLNRDGKRESLTITIPPGLGPGSTIRLRGQGHPSANGGQVGDLLVTVHVAPHPYFRRDGANLLVDVPVTPVEAALGAKVEVPTLSDGHMTLTLPPGTSSGAKLRLRGKGLLQKNGERGDLLAVVKIVVPNDLSDRERELYTQLKAATSHEPRSGLWHN